VFSSLIVLNVHAPTEDKISFYEEMELAVHKYLKYPMKNVLGDFNTKVA
jgi:hypothetical protein